MRECGKLAAMACMQLNTEVLELLFHVVLFFVYPEVSRKVEDEQGISS